MLISTTTRKKNDEKLYPLPLALQQSVSIYLFKFSLKIIKTILKDILIIIVQKLEEKNERMKKTF